MITNITLENFKCFRQVSINPKLLTVLIGPNGTGKSSILQALLLLKQSVDEDQINYTGRFINLSSREDLTPNFLSESFLIRIGIEGKLTAGMVKPKTEIRYSCAFHSDLHPIPVDSEAGSTHNELPRSMFSSVGLLLDRLSMVPSARGLVRPIYALGDDLVDHVSLQRGLGSQEEQLATNLGYGRSSEERLSKSLERITGTGLRTDAVPARSVSVKSLTPAGAVNIVSEGFGSNALIQLLLELIAAKKESTVLIEEPEIHLHPKAQAELAEVLAENAKAEDKQIIMTTHSEHLVERLLLLVAEGILSADDLAIYSFSKDEKGECFAAEIEVTENGQVEGGLTDFYANNLDTLDRRVKALKRSQ